MRKNSAWETDHSETEASRLHAETFVAVGDIEIAESNYTEAIKAYNRALPLFVALKHRPGQAQAHHGLARAYRQLHQDRAFEHHSNNALNLCIEVGNKRLEGEVLTTIGGRLVEQDRFEDAIPFFKQAMNIHIACENRLMEGAVRGKLGAINMGLSRFEEAMRYSKQALVIHRQVENRLMEGEVLCNIGTIFGELGEYDEAVRIYKQAQKILHEIKNRHLAAILFGNTATVYVKMKAYADAIEQYSQALQVYRECRDLRCEGIMTGNLGEVWAKQNQPDKAIPLLQKAITICETHSPIAAGSFHGSLAVCYASIGDSHRALTELELAEPMLPPNSTQLGKLYCQRGHIWLLNKDVEQARCELDLAKNIATLQRYGKHSELIQVINALHEAIQRET